MEVTLRNLPENTMEHNIDFHALTGALGDGALTHVLPGEQAVLRWKATKPGVFVYHCAPEGFMDVKGKVWEWTSTCPVTMKPEDEDRHCPA